MYGDALYNSIVALEFAGRHEQAREWLEAALAARIRAPGLRGFLLHKLSDVVSALDERDRAWELLDDIELLAASCAEPVRTTLLGDIAYSRGQLALSFGLIERARREVEHVRAHALVLGPENLLTARWPLLAADVALAAEDDALVIELLGEAWFERAAGADLALCGAGRVRRGLALSELARASGQRPDAAVAELERALATSDLSADHACSARLALADLALRNGDRAASVEHLSAVRAQPGFDIERRVRLAALDVEFALLFAASASELRALRDGLGRALDEFSAHWRAITLRPGGLGFLHWGTQRQAFSQWTRVELALDPLGGARSALARLIDAQSLGTLARRLDAQASFEQARSALTAAGAGVLVYLPAMDRSHVFALDADDVLHAELESRDNLVRLAEDLDAAWTTPPDDSAERRATWLAAGRSAADAFLPASIRERVARWTSCTIVGADQCGNPSFECFVLDDGRTLGLELALAYLPGIPLGVRIAERAAARAPAATGSELVCIAAPAHSASALRTFPRAAQLRLTDDERGALREPFESERVVLLEGPVATRAALAEPSLRAARVLAVLAHGVFDTSSDRPTALILAPTGDDDSGLLTCEQVEQLALPPLVELFACVASRGPARRGDDAAAHFVGACIVAGADCVLASRTELPRASIAELARTLHAGLRARGESPAEALRRARAYVAAQPETADPWYWAGISAHGLATQPLFEPRGGAAVSSESANRSSRALWIAAAAACAIVLGYAAWHRARSRRRYGGTAA